MLCGLLLFFSVFSSWALVRHLPSGASAWYPTIDNALGTANGYGDASTGYPTSPQAFNLHQYSQYFDASGEMMFDTGDRTEWVILKKSEIQTKTGDNVDVTLDKSNLNPASHTVRYYNRASGYDEGNNHQQMVS